MTVAILGSVVKIPVTILMCALVVSVLPMSSWAANSRVSFTVAFQGLESDLKIITTSVSPGATLSIKTSATATASDGTITHVRDRWKWTAPNTPGRTELRFTEYDESILMNVFVLTPFVNGVDTDLHGFKIGSYAKTLFRGLNSYAAPKGLIELTDGPADLKISPNFTLSQFICKQQPGHDPSYLLIRAAMLIKLETLLEAAEENGWPTDSFFIMSGYRTPYYNAAIGNTTTSSRHLYGGAADIWIDGNGDGQMDDLNGDGIINIKDARALANLAETLAIKGGRNWPVGGIGIYRANSAHGPFLHIDVRGYRARWE